MIELRKTVFENKMKSAVKDPQTVTVTIFVESGCSFEDGEYDKGLSGTILWSDLEKIEECLDNQLEEVFKTFPEDEIVEITLMEDGEWEDVHFWKYFIIKKVEIVDLVFIDEEELC
jgi:hypothetical protein